MKDVCIRAMKTLDDHDIGFEVKNNDIHFIVQGVFGFVDFYPTTGNWKERDGKKGYGLKQLINYIEDNT